MNTDAATEISPLNIPGRRQVEEAPPGAVVVMMAEAIIVTGLSKCESRKFFSVPTAAVLRVRFL